MSAIVIKSAVPTWSKPDPNVSVGHGKARPIQHYRKQLIPSSLSSLGSNSAVGMPMDVPGGSTVTNSNGCKVLTTRVNNNDNCQKTCTDGDGNKRTSEKKYYPATTNLSKTYYTDSRSYLRAKCKTYEQNSTDGKTLNCYSAECSSTKQSTSKPNGAVSSSSRLLRLKQKTFGSDSNHAYNPGVSLRNPSPIYLLKKQTTKCAPFRRNGKKQSVC